MNVRYLCFVVLIVGFGFADEPLPARVGLYVGEGTGPSREDVSRAIAGEVEIREVSAEEIRQGILKELDVLVHPGGSGSKQGKSLGKEGREAVREFVRRGGGYLGICAGAYLATNDYDWSLALIDAKVLDRRHWNRGNGEVVIQLSEAGKELFEEKSDEVAILYFQGPLLARREWDNEDVPDYESLAIYKTEIAEKGAPKGVMRGTTAIARAEFGKGRVFCFSPHPEKTEGLESQVLHAVKWVSRR